MHFWRYGGNFRDGFGFSGDGALGSGFLTTCRYYL